MRRLDVITGVLLAALGLGILAEARTIPPMLGQTFGPGFFPTIIGIGLALSGLLLAARAIVQPEAASPSQNGVAAVGPRPHVLALVWLLAGLAAIVFLFETAGFVLLLSVYLAGFMMLLGVRPLQAALLAVLLTAAANYIFLRLLLVPLPAGLLAHLTG